MRLYELNCQLKIYLATISVVSHDYSTFVRTAITAGSQQEARSILRKLFGAENVLSLTEIVKESPETDQIQQEHVVSPPTIARARQGQRIAQIQPSPVSRFQGCHKRQIPTQAIPDQTKHKIIYKHLTTQVLKRSNIVKPNSDDIRIARDEAEVQLKRANYELEQERKNS